MHRFVAALFLSLALAGCSSDNGLSSYVVTRGDVGADFVYTELDDDTRDAGVLGNPGGLDVQKIFDPDEGVRGGYIASFSRPDATDTPVIQSVALRFQNVTLATAWAVQNIGCGDEAHVFMDGSILLLVQPLAFLGPSEDAAAVEAAAATAAAALQQRTGAMDACADGGPIDEHH